jgi:hypothetical protein
MHTVEGETFENRNLKMLRAWQPFPSHQSATVIRIENAEGHKDRQLRSSMPPSVSHTRSHFLFLQRPNRPDKLEAHTRVLFHLTPCTFHVNILLRRKFVGDPIIRRGPALAVRVGSVCKSSFQVSADWAIHFCPLRFTS